MKTTTTRDKRCGLERAKEHMSSNILAPRSPRALFDVRIANVLLPREKVVWYGQPDVELAVRSTWFLVAFGTFWTAFSVFWTCMALGSVIPRLQHWTDAPALLFPMFGLPFVAIGVAMLSSPYLTHRFTKRVFFVVTNKRALIVNVDKLPTTSEPREHGKGWAFTAYWPAQMVDPERTEHAGKCYNLTFIESKDSEGTLQKTGFMFLTIGVADAENALRSLLRHHRAL